MPLPAQGRRFLGWSTGRAMQVVDRVGDTHARVIACLKAADGAPAHVDPELS
ncbi:hypothetical protein OHV05_34190 [Kitasatospora sp. NBC_00070]|uniref:hypothetical protein n=1 Tax=Kitasatospora sp. NBC_00070 TaxID=2975962 RepID=UPI00324AB665